MRFLLFTISWIISCQLIAQNLSLSGFIHDAQTGEALIGASVYVTSLKKGIYTNGYGFFSLTLPPTDSMGIVFSYAGYEPQIKKVFLNQNVQLDIKLVPKEYSLGEVVISARAEDENVRAARMGVIDIPVGKLMELPVLLGEADVLKVVQLLPGVQSGNEGTTGYFVRGGNADQNLVLLDEAIVYNPNHLFGLFSTFNSRALNNVTLIKGGFPAQYGGRLSSFLDIRMKEGNNRQYGVQGGLGLISSHLMAEGPLKKDKASFIISARRTYLDLLIRPFLPRGNASDYHFYDLNAKVNWKITPRDQVFLSGFTGNDLANYKAAQGLNYRILFGNSTATLRWNHLFGQKLFVNTSLIYNQYKQDIAALQDNYFSSVYSGINDLNAKTEFQYFPNFRHSVRFGAQYTRHKFLSTGKSATHSGTLPETGKPEDQFPSRFFDEVAVYANDEIVLNDMLSFNLGLRVPGFISKDVDYYRIEPRATLKWALGPVSSVKASYTMMNQFLHLIPSSTASVPSDIWVPSSQAINPQFSTQYALGYFRNFREGQYESSVEFYYKNMDKQVLFKEGVQLIGNFNPDSLVVYGKGWSYGAEFFLKKNTGKLTGWISYTLSWTNQQFDELNYGKVFPFRYDRRHNLSVVGTYKLNDRWTLSSVFVFSSGIAYTLPVARFNSYYGGSLFEGSYQVYEARNNYRMNPYHRLDFSGIYRRPATLFKKEFQSEWVLGVYNVYSRQNPYFVYVMVDPATDQPKAKQVSLLPILPNISYNFKF